MIHHSVQSYVSKPVTRTIKVTIKRNYYLYKDIKSNIISKFLRLFVKKAQMDRMTRL